MKICSRFMRHLVMALVLLSSATFAHAVQVTSTWTGAGDGTSYTDAANWSTPNFPRNGTPSGTTYKAIIDGNNGKVANVNFNTSVTIDALVVTGGDSFNINTGTTLSTSTRAQLLLSSIAARARAPLLTTAQFVLLRVPVAGHSYASTATWN